MSGIVAPDWAAPFVGVPFEDRGRSLDAADCWGVFRLVLLRRFGVALPDIPEGYAGTEAADAPQIAALVRDELGRGVWHPVAAGAERPGDGILIRMHGQPMHVGVVLVPGLGLHTLTTTGSVLLRYREMMYRNTVLGFYRHAELMDR